MWCAARRFDTPSLGFILIPDNPKEMLCGAFTRKHKFEFVCNLTKRMRKKIFKRGGKTEADSWGSLQQSMASSHNLARQSKNLGKRNRSNPSH